MTYKSGLSSAIRFVLVLIAGLYPLQGIPLQIPDPSISAPASRYLIHVLDIMQRNALHAKEIDWPALRVETFWHAEGAQRSADTYPAIYFALSRLKERHSFLQLPENLSEVERKRAAADINVLLRARNSQFHQPPPSPFRSRMWPEGHLVYNGNRVFAYVTVPMCCKKQLNRENDQAEFQKYADTLHDLAARLAVAYPRGWIIDLRGNIGGNMYPMLAGIGLVLGQGTAGSFVGLDGSVKSNWSYHQGDALIDGRALSAVKSPPLVLDPLPPAAALIDSGTISSGEAIAVSLAGRPLTRFFGTRTSGLASANTMFPLADGAALFLNTVIDADRLGRTYPNGIEPDVSFPEPATLPDEASDPVLQAAKEWLSSLPAGASSR